MSVALQHTMQESNKPINGAMYGGGCGGSINNNIVFLSMAWYVRNINYYLL